MSSGGMSMPVPHTPQRPLPGAYIQTPANRLPQPGQIRQPSFRDIPVPTQPQHRSQQQGQAVATKGQQGGQGAGRIQEELKPIERASRTINEVLIKETQYPELDSYVSR